MTIWHFDKPAKPIFALLSGLLLTASFPRLGWAPVAWVALVPLLLALRDVTARQAALLGGITGAAHFLGLIYWLAGTMHLYGKLPWVLGALVLVLFILYLALYPALFAVLVHRLCRRPIHLWLWGPALWVLSEYLRAGLLTGFPWELLGYSQYKVLPAIQIADTFGVLGVSALIALANTSIAVAVLAWVQRSWQGRVITRRFAGLAVGLTAAVAAVAWGYGRMRIEAVDRQLASANHKPVAVIQGNIEQDHKWDPRFQILTTVKYNRLSQQAAVDQPALIIWPETATPFYLTRDQRLSHMVIETVKSSGTHFLIGSPYYIVRNGKPVYFNSAFMVNPEGKATGRYDKVHLVPFGEYVPLQRWLPFGKLVAQVGDFDTGRPGVALDWQDHQVGVLICYEAIFPSLARAMAQNGASLLVNLTNDAWFGRTSAAYQHFSMAVFRAVENRRTLVRAANTGISGMVDPAGRILAASRLFENARITRTVPLADTASVYTRWGNGPLVLVLLIMAAAGHLAAAIGSRQGDGAASAGPGATERK